MATFARMLSPCRIVFCCSGEYDANSEVFSYSIQLSRSNRESLHSAGRKSTTVREFESVTQWFHDRRIRAFSATAKITIACVRRRVCAYGVF